MCKEYSNIVIYSTPVLLCIKKLNSLIYRMLLLCQHIRELQPLKTVQFVAHPVVLVIAIMYKPNDRVSFVLQWSAYIHGI